MSAISSISILVEDISTFTHQQKQLGTMKRSMFKAEMQDLVRDFYGVGLRRDVPNELGKQQEAWRWVRLIEAEDLAA
jgi:hypothetical protein